MAKVVEWQNLHWHIPILQQPRALKPAVFLLTAIYRSVLYLQQCYQGVYRWPRIRHSLVRQCSLIL